MNTDSWLDEIFTRTPIGKKDISVGCMCGICTVWHKQAKARIKQEVVKARIDEVKKAEQYDKAQKGIYSGEVYRRNRIKELKKELKSE